MVGSLTSSRQPRKQRWALYNAPLHVRHRLMAAPLSDELVRQYGVARLPVRRGDTVLVVRGDHRGVRGKVIRVDLRRMRIYVDGASYKKPNGEVVYYPIHPSKVVIVELDTSDKRRMEAIEEKRKRRESLMKALEARRPGGEVTVVGGGGG